MDYLQIVKLKEPSDDEAFVVLENISHRLEHDHGVMITWQALDTAINLSQRYIHDRVLPDKAKTILDEACLEVKDGTKLVTSEEVAKLVTRLTGVPVTHVGKEEKKKLLKLEDELEYAYQRAIRYIGYRMRSIQEVKHHLNQQGIENHVIEKVIFRLQKNGLLDDLNFAQMWIENRNEFRPRSHRMLSFELKQKGVQSEIISQILQETTSEEILAYRAAIKQARKYEQLEWQTFRRRLSSFLARRGFPYSVIKPTVDQVWSEQNIERTEIDRDISREKS